MEGRWRWLGLLASLGVHLLLVLPPAVPAPAHTAGSAPDVRADELVWLEQTTLPTGSDDETADVPAATAESAREPATAELDAAGLPAPSAGRNSAPGEQAARPDEAQRQSSSASRFAEHPAPPQPTQGGRLATTADRAGDEPRDRTDSVRAAAKKSVGGRAHPATEESRREPAFDLSPANVALLALRKETCPDGRDAGVANVSSDAVSPRAKALRSQRTMRQLARAAQEPAEGGAPGPTLMPRAGGGYNYESDVLKAEINRDGEVSFGVKRADEWYVTPFALFGVFRFDGIADKAAGNDLQTSEKRWFLERTSELREFLVAEAREKQLEAARLRLLAKLERIAQADYLTVADKHEAIFALWDDCSPDGVGERAQLVIEDFVRAEMPEGNESAFSADELLAFNARRLGPRPFNPYRDAG